MYPMLYCAEEVKNTKQIFFGIKVWTKGLLEQSLDYKHGGCILEEDFVSLIATIPVALWVVTVN